MHAKAYAAMAAKSPLVPHTIQRRSPRPYDVAIDIEYTGICHSDLHEVNNEWGGASYPLVPGHEIIGRVKSVGEKVTRFSIGERVGVGCFVDSCRMCSSCRDSEEQYCERGPTTTYNGKDRLTGEPTYGGYSSHIVVDEHFVLKVPENLDAAAAAPLLCAGITTYSPLRHWKVGPGTRVGVVGIGGLGHMAIKLAAAMGADVTALSTSAAKKQDAHRLGASDFINTRNGTSAVRNHFDLILNTVSNVTDFADLLRMVRKDGTMVLLGVPENPAPLEAFSVIGGRKSVSGSLVGGLEETQEMLNFCGRHAIVSDVELITPQEINTAYERMLKSQVKYRFVIDISKLK